MTITTPPTPPPWETEDERRRALPVMTAPALAGRLELIELRLQVLSAQLSGISARLPVPCSLCRGEGCESPTCGRGPGQAAP